MSNSPLVSYKKISPNRTVPRNHKIDTITIHCYVGQVSVESMAAWLCNPNAGASANYGIGSDGRIVLLVDENDRSWCSSSGSNDHRAITIECASDMNHPYAINDKVYNSLIALCTDICKRNNIKELKWKGNKNLIGQVDEQNMTVHRWFANKVCPGDYIYNRLGRIASEVNAILGTSGSETVKPNNKPEKKVLYRVRKTWEESGSQIGAFAELKNAKNCADSNPGYSVFNSTGEIVYSTKTPGVFQPFEVKVKIDDLNIRTGPGTEYEKTGHTTGVGVFGIVAVQPGKGSDKGWGKLKSGAGWISLDFAKRI